MEYLVRDLRWVDGEGSVPVADLFVKTPDKIALLPDTDTFKEASMCIVISTGDAYVLTDDEGWVMLP